MAVQGIFLKSVAYLPQLYRSRLLPLLTQKHRNSPENVQRRTTKGVDVRMAAA